nr:thermonuclease family protein [uncultured Peptostreptococcus sp.]
MLCTIKNKLIKFACVCISACILISLVSCSSREASATNFEKARVVRVIDGDTLHVIISGKKYKLRMVGVDTPETVHPNKPVQFYGKEASDYTKKQLNNRDVYLQKDVSDTDKYGRLLRYVWLKEPLSNNPSQDEISKYMYNAQLIMNGYAYSYTYQPDTRYSEFFSKLQGQARNKSLGLWNENKLKSYNQKHPENIETRPLNNGKPTKSSHKTSSYRSLDTKKDRVTAIKDEKNTKYIKANRKSKVYHIKGSRGYYSVSDRNAVYFDSESDAISAGYRRSKR